MFEELLKHTDFGVRSTTARVLGETRIPGKVRLLKMASGGQSLQSAHSGSAGSGDDGWTGGLPDIGEVVRGFPGGRSRICRRKPD